MQFAQPTAVSILALAGVCGGASAATTVNILVNGGSQLDLYPGSGVHHIDVLVTVSTTATNAIGLGSMIFQPTVSNFGNLPGDALVAFTSAFGSNTSTPSGAVPDAQGQYGRITPFAAVNLTSSQRLFGHLHTGFSAGAPPGTWLRIAQAQVTSWIGSTGNTTGGSGVNIKQLNNIGRTTADPAFLAQTSNVHVLRFALQIDTGFPSDERRTLTVDAPLAGFGNLNTTTGNREVYWYADMNEVAGSVREVPIVNTARIQVLLIPAPASLALLGLGGLAVARRRR
jgi:hypothetical protein